MLRFWSVICTTSLHLSSATYTACALDNWSLGWTSLTYSCRSSFMHCVKLLVSVHTCNRTQTNVVAKNGITTPTRYRTPASDQHLFLFWQFRVWISAGKRSIPIEMFHSFSQSLQMNSGDSTQRGFLANIKYTECNHVIIRCLITAIVGTASLNGLWFTRPYYNAWNHYINVYTVFRLHNFFVNIKY
jgi:hypothetical protein